MTQQTDGSPIRFGATLSTIDTSTVLRLPDTASKNLPSRGQVAVHGTINSVAFQTVLEPDGNLGHWMTIDDRQQHLAGISAGDTATLDIEVTKDWPEPSVPQDLATGLADAPQNIRDLWNDITPMARWEWVRWVNATKNPDTRGRRVDVTISMMKSGKRRPLLFQPLRMHRPGPVEERQAPRARRRPPLTLRRADSGTLHATITAFPCSRGRRSSLGAVAFETHDMLRVRPQDDDRDVPGQRAAAQAWVG